MPAQGADQGAAPVMTPADPLRCQRMRPVTLVPGDGRHGEQAHAGCVMQQSGDPAGCGVGHRAVLSRREQVRAAAVRNRLVKMPAASEAAVDRRSAHEADVIAVARQRLAKRRTKEYHVIRGCDPWPRGAGELYLAWTKFDLQ